MKRPQAEQLKAVPEPLETRQQAARKPERETFAVYRLPDEDDAGAEREFLLTLPVDIDVERRIKKDYGAGSYRIERRRGGRFVSVHEFHLDEPPQREPEEEEEREQLVDLDERIERAVFNALEARREARAREKARMMNPAPAPTLSVQPQPAPVDPLNDLVRTVTVLKQLGVPIGEQPSPRAHGAEAAKDDDDRVLLSLLKDRDLRRRIASSVTSLVSDTETNERHWAEVALDALDRHPKLIARVGALAERFIPARAESADDDDEETASAEDRCAEYLLEKCAANEPVTLNDEPLRTLAAEAAEQYQDLIAGLQIGTVDQIITHLVENFDGARLVLRTPHARSWIERLKDLALSA